MYHIWFYAECQLHSVSTSLLLCFGLCECYVCLVALQLVCFEGRQRCGQLGNSTVSAIVIVFDHEKLSCVSSAGFAKGTGIQLHTLHSLYHFNDESPIGQQRDQHEELLRRRQQVHLSDVTQLCSVMRFICFYISMESTSNRRYSERPRRQSWICFGMMPISRASSISSITVSTMSLNVVTVTLKVGASPAWLVVAPCFLDTVDFLVIGIVGQSKKGGDEAHTWVP